MTSADWLTAATSRAMDALLARLDLERGGRPFFWVDYQAQPPQARHAYWDRCDIAARFVDALALARLVTGRRDGQEAEDLLRRFLWAHQDDRDGLFYNPDDEQVATNAEVSKYIPRAGVMTAGRHVDLFCQRAPLLAMTTLLQLGDDAMRPRLERMVRGLRGLGRRQDDGICFATYRWAEELRPEWSSPTTVPERWQGYRYALLTGLSRYAQVSGDPAAVELALGLARHYQRHGDVPADGRFRANTHSGGVLPTTVGVARLGVALDQPEMLAWAHRVFLWTRANTPDFGFLTDGLGLDGFFAGTCETCALADYLHLALLLSEAGLGDYWDDLERVARNQLLENQYRDRDAMRRLFPGISERVLAMLDGGFECAAYPNDLFSWSGAEGCCIGGGIRALYLAWRGAVTETASEVRVNAGITRAAAAARVTAFEPWEGRVDVEALADRRVSIRLPGHADTSAAVGAVDGAVVGIGWSGRYASFGILRAGQTASLKYPVRERRATYRIAGTDYAADWRGHVVLEMTPAGQRHPIYRRRAVVTTGPPTATDRPPSRGPDAPVLW